jgi:hypothetical protein
MAAHELVQMMINMAIRLINILSKLTAKNTAFECGGGLAFF